LFMIFGDSVGVFVQVTPHRLAASVGCNTDAHETIRIWVANATITRPGYLRGH
jgi:hypothetical protein